MNNDFTSLAGITAAAKELNTKAEALGLDMDLELRPEEDRARVTFWLKPNGVYHLEWSTFGLCTEEGIAACIDAANEWIIQYKDTRKERLAEMEEKMEAELASIRRMLAEAEPVQQ